MNRFKPLTLSLSLLLSTASTVQAGHYDGPGIDYNFIETKPAKYAQCDRYLNDNTARRFAACEFGRDEAERVSERYGGGNGRLEGFLRGFAWGLHKATRANQNDATEIERGEAAVEGMGQYMESGLRAGERDGSTRGQNLGRSEAISRWVRAMETGAVPSDQAQPPAQSYTPEENAYTRYVGPVPTQQQILQNDLTLGEIPVYHERDAVFLGDIQPLNIWDLIFDDGTYAFERTRWSSDTAALALWKRVPIDTRPKYENLNNPPLLDTTPGALPGATIDLQAVFDQGFTGSYGWYVNYYFSREFQRNLDLGQVAGEQAGVQLGKRLAQYRGTERAFNRKFKESSLASFQGAYEQSYNQTFRTTFDHYARNAILSVRPVGLVGEINDGILQPGERVKVKFTVENSGGVASDLNISLSGSVQDTTTERGRIERLSRRTFETGFIAQIDPRLGSRDTARIILRVNDVTADLSSRVDLPVQIQDVDTTLQPLAGTGRVTVSLKNITTVRTTGRVSVTLNVGGVGVQTLELGILEAGEVRVVPLEVSGIDPLVAIDHSYNVTVTTLLSGLATETRQDRLSHNQDALTLTLRYLTQVANGGGVIPAGVTREDRLEQITSRISALNLSEVRRVKSGSNLYKSTPYSTVLGRVIREFKDNIQSTEAQAAFKRLGGILKAQGEILHRRVIKGRKFKSYMRLVAQLQ